MFTQPFTIYRIPKPATFEVSLDGITTSRHHALKPVVKKETDDLKFVNWFGDFSQCSRLQIPIENTKPVVEIGERLYEFAKRDFAENNHIRSTGTIVKNSAAAADRVKNHCSLKTETADNMRANRSPFLITNPIAYFKKNKT